MGNFVIGKLNSVVSVYARGLDVGESIIFPQVGYRVCAIHGLHGHGPLEGPKVSVPSDTLGQIIRLEKPYYAPTIGDDLYVIEWDTHQITKHYFREFGDILCIGPFKTLATFESALKSANTGQLVWGPQGGFREFRTTLQVLDGELLVLAVKEQSRIWDSLGPLIRRSGMVLTETKLDPKRKTRF